MDGIGEARADNKSRSCLAESKDYGAADWDDKPPSAELRPDQKDQDTLPPYEILDKILELYARPEEGEIAEVAEVVGMRLHAAREEPPP